MRQGRCIIVGAGICGLLAARTLQAAGVEVTVLDKGRGVGGRLATRRLGDAVFDHGAQYFTARAPSFRSLVEQWQASGIVARWFERDQAGTAEPCYAALGGMTQLAKHLAVGLDVRTDVHVMRLTRQAEEWQVHAATGETWQAEAVVLTAPAPQSLVLAESGGLPVPEPLRSQLASLQYDPCLTLMVTLAGPPLVPPPGGLKPDRAPISWLSDNGQKGVSPLGHAVTIQATAAWSQAMFEMPDAFIAEALIAAASPWFAPESVRGFELQKWRYSIARRVLPELFARLHAAPSLFMAGDACGGPRVEGAALSGLAAAHAVLATVAA